MGQYYSVLVIDENNKVTKVSPGTFRSFSKLTEHSWIGNPYVNAVYSLIRNRPRKVVWIGDYAIDPFNPDEDVYAQRISYAEFKTLYQLAHGENPSMEKGFFFKADLNCLDYDTVGMYLLNHDRKSYIDIAAYIKASSVPDSDNVPWCLSPLPLLTACGNGRGGGDFYSQHTGYSDVGTWAFQVVEYTDHVPEGYQKAEICFRED
jgi:hypothetical protein